MNRLERRLLSLERSVGLDKPAPPLSPGQQRWSRYVENHPRWGELQELIPRLWPNGGDTTQQIFANDECFAIFQAIDDDFWEQELAARRARGVACDCHSFSHPSCGLPGE